MPADRPLHPAALAGCVLPAGDDLDATLRFFVEELGFRLDSIGPADAPSHASLSGHGLRIQLEGPTHRGPGLLRLTMEDPTPPRTLTAPNGTRIEFVANQSTPEIPPPCPRARVHPFDKNTSAAWCRGRAGMLYRDLIPDRAGGYLIASHIRIPDGGPVPDDVHHHAINFQFIFCHRGWVRLVYEDQGDPFVLEAGDCVLQPPHIRHRVLEASDGLEVIELASPAAHMTFLDHDISLPTGRHLPNRDYSGQTFVLHQARHARWEARPGTSFQACDLGLMKATAGRVNVHVVRRSDSASDERIPRIERSSGLAFLFVLHGELTVALDGVAETRLGTGGSCVISPASPACLRECSANLEILEVVCPA